MCDKPDLPTVSADSRVLVYSTTGEGRDLIKKNCRFQENFVDYASTVAEAKALLASGSYTSLMADFTLLDFTGKELMLWAQAHYPQTTVFYLSRSAAPYVAAEVWNVDGHGMFRHVGHQHDSITPLLNTLFTEHPANSWAANVSGEFIKARKRLDNTSYGKILLIGAAGTGKYALSQIAHFRSARENNPFVFINCKCRGKMEPFEWSEQMLEYFRINMRNIMTAANGGTLYFHEIDHLAVNVQCEIAEILKSGIVDSPDRRNYERFSGLVVCSTRHNLEELVRVDDFSDSLFQLMNDNVIRVPSLSDYKDEILVIAEEILHNYCVMKNIPVKSFTKEASALLAEHVWGRNIRELYDTVKHAADLCAGKLIKGDNILFDSTPHTSDGFQNKRCKIKSALKDAKGNITEAAKRLHVSRKTLYAWIAEYEIPKNYGKPDKGAKAKK